MPISGGDLTNMRTGQQLVIPHLNVTPKVVIATMQINQTDFSYPLAQVTVDNVSMNGGLSFADIPVGSMIYVGSAAGLHDITTSVVRKAPSGTTLFISAIGPGDPGFTQFEHEALADDQFITILAVKPIWSLLSRIANQIFYKQFDVPYTDEGDDPDPVCNIGPHRRLELTGATVSETFTNAAVTDVKVASFAWGSKTISSYAWSFRDANYALNTGGSFSGGVSNTAAVTIDFDTAGFYIVYCTITDSGGKTHTGETYVWVDDGSLDLTGWYLDNDQRDRTGRKMTFGLYGDTAESVVYPGAGFLYTEEQIYNGATVTAGATVTTFFGYARQEKPIRQIAYGRTLFEVVGPSYMLDEIPNASQYIIEDDSPSDWTQVTSDLSNASGVAWYLLKHHCPAMLQVFDFAPLVEPGTSTLDTRYRDRTWLFSASTLWRQIREIMKYQINIGCDSLGTLYLRHDPQTMDDTDRDAIDNRMTWGASDVREMLESSKLIRLNTGMVDAYAFSYDGTDIGRYWSRSPSDSQAQGKTTSVINGMITLSSGGQTRLNELSGHLFAKVNNPTPRLTLKAMRNFDTAEPARMEWHTFNIPATYDPRGVGWVDQRMLPEKVTCRWERSNRGTWLKRVDNVFQPETSGQPGLTKEIPVSADDDFGQFGDWPDPFDWGFIIDDLPTELLPPDIDEGEPIIAGISADGYLYTTPDFTTTEGAGGPTWSRTNLSMTGTPVQFVVDAFSPGYIGTGTSINGWIVTTTNIYRLTDIFGTPGVVSQLAFVGTTDIRNIDFSFGVSGWGICTTYYDSSFAPSAGVYVTYTTNGGTTWSTETAITNHYNTGTFQDLYPALYVSPRTPGLAYTFAFSATGAGPASAFYRTLDYGASWAVFAGPPNVSAGTGLGMDMHFAYSDPTEQTVYHGFTSWAILGDNPYYLLYETIGAVSTNISPQESGAGGARNAGPSRSRWSVGTSNQDVDYIFVCTKGAYVNRRIYRSTNGTPTWTEIQDDGSNRLSRAAFSGDNKSVMYRWNSNTASGDGNIIEYSDDIGATWDDRSGNLRALGPPGEFIGICGRGGS